MSETNNYYAVILAGGGGTRLWPKSRKKHPKHLLRLFGDETLLQMTYNRIAPILPKENILVITNIDHIEDVKSQLPEMPSENVIGEPKAKNTALAMGVAAAVVHHRNQNASVIYLAADHIYKDIAKFQDTALNALEVSQLGDYIVAIGIKPTFAHTGLGYIKIGDQLEDLSSKKRFVFTGKGFKEKPDLATAQSFLASGQYLWNANLYCWKTETIFKSFEALAPKIKEALDEVMTGLSENELNSALHKIYGWDVEFDSIDYEVSEKAKNIIVLPGDFGWSDIGDWKIVYETENKDSDGNAIINKNVDSVTVDSRDNLIDSNGKMIAVVGLSNIVVIETDDAILVCHKDRSQDVKKVVEKLKQSDKKQYL